MNVPSGYSALDLVGFTDKGDYSASANYVKNDLVHYNDKIWKCLIDDTTGIAPTTGVNWDIWIDQSNSLDGLADVEITNAQDGQELSYDGITQKWKNTSKIQTLTNQVKDMNNVYGSKNLLPNDVTSQTVSGVTYTKNADGTITINGTRTTAGGITISEFSLEAGKKYKYSIGNPFNLSNTAGSNIQGYDGTAWVALGNIFGTETEAEFESNSAYSKYRVNINSNNGVTFSNLTIKPMIRLASIEDDTYVPYAKSNKELTEELTVTTGQIARLVSFSTLSSYHVRKYGKVVELYFAGTLSEAVNRWTDFLTVPDGFRPSHHVQIVSFNTYNSCKNLQLAPSGGIQSADNLAVDDFIRFTVTYIID